MTATLNIFQRRRSTFRYVGVTMLGRADGAIA